MNLRNYESMKLRIGRTEEFFESKKLRIYVLQLTNHN